MAPWVAMLAMTACSDDSQPIAYSTVHHSLEEAPVVGYLSAWDREGDGLAYFVDGAHNGHVELDVNTGRFEFQPDTDFFGTAGFTFHARANGLDSFSAKVSIVVENVNDAPRIAAIPDLENSAYTEEVVYQVVVTDPDPDPPVVSGAADDPTVVDVAIDNDTRRLSLRAKQLGVTTINVVASDSSASDSVTFTFTAGEAEKEYALSFSDPTTGAVTLTNHSDRPVDLVLTHNDFPLFESLESVVEYVRALPAEFPGEAFERKLWRFVRDSVYHELPLSTRRFYYDPWTTLNSLGWGLCGHAAAAFVEIARAAGYNARIWGLEGHVVSEIEVDGRWSLYDADLAVYYKTRDGRVAGVEELEADPSLMTQPIDPIFEGSWYQFPYSNYVANIYSTADDNYNGERVFLRAHDSSGWSRLVLPPGATLTYPGKWTEPPLITDNTVSYEVPHYAQALLALEDGWTGRVTLPWVIWEVLGTGQVEIQGSTYEIGSVELRNRLRNTRSPITSVEVYTGSSVQLVFFVNATRMNLEPDNRVGIRALHAWAITAEGTGLAAPVAAGLLPTALGKPWPTGIP